MPRQVMAHYAAMTTNWSGSQSYVSSLRVGVKRLYRQEWWRRLMIGGRNASSIGGRTVNSEVTEAFSRWLAGAPEWSHNAFLCLRNEIGLGLLVVENAARCGVTVDKLEWRYGQHFYATIGGYSFEIDGPWWDESTVTKWTAHPWSSPTILAATFPELFDLIAQCVNELNESEGSDG